ncbi:MAG: vWA domain-containing protein [Acidimicrobiales bacterium]
MTQAASGALGPASSVPPDQAARIAVAFVRAVRGAGVPVGGGAAIDYVQALHAVGLDDAGAVYWAGRATLVRRPEDVEVYDAVHRAFWARGGRAEVRAGIEVHEEPVTLAIDREDDDEVQEPAEEPTGKILELRYSAAEVLRDKDFADCTPAEIDEARRLMAAVRWSGALRRTRRRRPAGRRGDWPDVRRTVKRALRTGGEPLERRWLETVDRQRRVVFLCDVSGSMAPYARALLRFLHVAVAGRPRVEAFTIGTRLTRVTRALSARDPDAALGDAARAVRDWSGGTRLGDALREFNDRWGSRGLARGAVVVVLSDGWDRGDPAVLAAEMARLSRVAHQIVWVNPLKATPGYAPLVRGMAAALPYVDQFVEGHSVASLEALVEVLGTPGRRRRGVGIAVAATPEGEGAGEAGTGGQVRASTGSR